MFGIHVWAVGISGAEFAGALRGTNRFFFPMRAAQQCGQARLFCQRYGIAAQPIKCTVLFRSFGGVRVCRERDRLVPAGNAIQTEAACAIRKAMDSIGK